MSVPRPHNVQNNINCNVSIMPYLRPPKASSRGKKDHSHACRSELVYAIHSNNCPLRECKNFAISFAGKRACRNNLSDQYQQGFISSMWFTNHVLPLSISIEYDGNDHKHRTRQFPDFSTRSSLAMIISPILEKQRFLFNFNCFFDFICF